jgi:hypothetical protein
MGLYYEQIVKKCDSAMGWWWSKEITTEEANEKLFHIFNNVNLRLNKLLKLNPAVLCDTRDRNAVKRLDDFLLDVRHINQLYNKKNSSDIFRKFADEIDKTQVQYVKVQNILSFGRPLCKISRLINLMKVHSNRKNISNEILNLKAELSTKECPKCFEKAWTEFCDEYAPMIELTIVLC